MELEMNIWTIIVTVFLLVGLTLLFFRADIWHYLRKIVRDEAVEDLDVANTMVTASGTGMNHERENYFRMCILIVDFSLKILQDVLCKELESEYPYLFKPSTGLLHRVLDDKEVKKNLNKLPPRVFFQDQRNQLYPAGSPSTSVTVGDLDVTLTVLLLRNITQLKHSPRHAWDNPSDIDTSKAAAIGRIKKYRNSVYAHANKTAITDKDFKEYFQGLKSNLQTLSSRFTDTDYDDILSEPLDTALLEKYQKLLEEWCEYDQDVKDLLMAVKSRVEELPQQMWGMMNYFFEKFAQKLEDHSLRLSKGHTTEGDSLHITKQGTTSQAPVMSPTHKNLLVKMGPMLKENLQIEDIIPDMVDIGIFNEQNAEKLKACKPEGVKVDEFLRIIQKCGPYAFDSFVEVLRKHNYKELAASLDKKATASSSKIQIANFYIHYMSQIQRLPWDPDDTMHLDDIYVNLQWVQEERKPTGTISGPIQSYTAILNDTKQGKTPKRILIRGKAGIGKTTFTQKMATDWANATLGLGKRDEVLYRYEHVLIINLRSIQPGQTLKEAIETQITCSAENIKAVTDEVMQALNNATGPVLLVFDGYDEYDINTSEEITDIIYRRRYQDVCTVITTRPWKAGELMNRRIMDSVCVITGLTEENIAEYVAKFFNDKQTYDEYLELKSVWSLEAGIVDFLDYQKKLGSIGNGLVGYIQRKELMSLVEIPILLLFICLMWQEDQASDAKTKCLPASCTLLYTKLIQLLSRRRYEIRTQVKMEQSACVKNLEEQTFISLGKLAYDGLVKPNRGLIFDERDLQTIPDVNELYSLGLLSKCKVHSNFDVKHEVTFPHKTIQEFFAAKYLARKLDQNDSNILDLLLGNVDTLGKLYGMSYVLRFLCGLSRRATVHVLHKIRSLIVRQSIEAIRTECFYSPGLSVNYVYSRHSQWCNGLLLEHWYAHCPQETVLPPELISCHTVLCIPGSFQHSDPRFQQVLNGSVDSLLSSPQIYSGMLKGLTAVGVDRDMLVTKIPDDIPTRRQEIEHKVLSLLRTCDMFEELVWVFWKTISHTCDDCTYTVNHVISKAPNLQTLEIATEYSGALSSIPNPGKLLHLEVSDINVQDCQVIQQMGHLECINVSGGLSRDPPPQLGLIPITSHDLTRIDISFTHLRAVGVQLLGRNLHHVPGLEHLGLDSVFKGGSRCGPDRCTCPRGEDTTNYDRCQDVCEAVRELSQGVIHTTKLKDFSFSFNHLGQYHGITSPLIALIQSLSTVSEQTGMRIDMSCNGLGSVDRLSELRETIVSSYQHVSSWNLWYNNLEKIIPKPGNSLKCKFF